MDLLLIVLMAFLGALLGLGLALMVPAAPVTFVVWTICVFTTTGVVVAYCLLKISAANLASNRRRNRKTTLRVRPAEAHRNFAERLRSFVKQTEAEGAEKLSEQSSSMPFWTSKNQFVRSPPKSSSVIRRLLRNIRRILHG